MRKSLSLLLFSATVIAVCVTAWHSLKWHFNRRHFDLPLNIVWGQYNSTIQRDGKNNRFITVAMVDGGKWRVEVKRDHLGDLISVYDGMKQSGSFANTENAAAMEPKHDLDVLLQSLNLKKPSAREALGGAECLLYHEVFSSQFTTSVWIDETTGFPWHMRILRDGHTSESKYAIFKLGYHDPWFFDTPNDHRTILFDVFEKEVKSLESRSD